MEPLHQIGDIIAERYRLIKILGQGGIGITYEAEEQETGKRVALKEVSLRRLTDWKVLELFEREARVLSELNHPSIPAYLDYFQVDTASDRSFYLVQEIAPGKSLSALVEAGWRASEGEAQKLAIRVLEILNYLHSLTPPVIHRDIKPQNIILAEDGQVSLVDFGAVQDTYRHTFAGSSTVVGTYGYMAPEQFRCQAEPATDLYGLGATLLFFLTHQSPADLPQHRLKIEFRSLVQISDDFAGWIETLIEPAVEDRFSSAKEALAVLLGKREMIYPLASTLQQPAGSHIVLKKTASRLFVEILPTKVRSSNLGIEVVAIISFASLILFGIVLFLALIDKPFLSLPHIIFTFIWLIVIEVLCVRGLGYRLFKIIGSEKLEIDRQTFRLRWKMLGVSDQVQGEAKNLELRSDVVSCTLVAGVKKYRFGSKLTPAEKEWLVAELNNFLGKLRYK